MSGLIERLPSPAGFALWLYALCFAVLPALLAWQGFAYVVGIVLFAVGLRPSVAALARDPRIHFALTVRGEQRTATFRPSVRGEAWVVRLVSWGLLALTILVLPILVYVVQSQGRLFFAEISARLPVILAELQALLDAAHGWVPSLVPSVRIEQGAGWSGLRDLLGGAAGADVKALLPGILGDALATAGSLLGAWVKLVIGALIVGTILAGYETESRMHRGIIARGIRDARLRRNVLRFGELYQSGISLFMIGYLEVAVTLALLYAIAMAILPLGLGVGAILFMALVLGAVTAIPKIGGILGMGVAALLMIGKLAPGLGWVGIEVVSFGWAADTLIRVGLLMAVAKLMGLLEAYNYTPEIVGRKLGLTKMQIIATVVIWAVGAGVFGMIWGVLLSLTFQAALRLSHEVEAAGEGPEGVALAPARDTGEAPPEAVAGPGDEGAAPGEGAGSPGNVRAAGD
jgi:predicted PurR-regulated permease PerM